MTRTRLGRVLDRLLPDAHHAPAKLHEAMRYAVLGGGKRIRPLLCFAAGDMVDASAQALELAAAAIEMMHIFSLVHDDLPAMDNDTMRHGQPAVHARYGEATALLVGDALQSQAFITLSHFLHDTLPDKKRMALVYELATATGSMGMAGGQAIDLDSVGMTLSKDTLEMMHQMKTGCLFHAALRMGILCARSPVQPHIAKAIQLYGNAIGLVYQVVDDVLDASALSSTLGKTAGKDARCAKPTYVSMLGMAAARKLIVQLHKTAQAALVPVGAAAHRLIQLANLIVDRVNQE